jgi:DNA-directed RNA polymerase subunit M/transcription elongation factor TFIIS
MISDNTAPETLIDNDNDNDNNDFYSNRIVLPGNYYKSAYNNIRRARVIVIGCCLRNYGPFKDLHINKQEEHIRRIERSCYNHTCVSADKKNVPRNWQNTNFIILYNIIAYRVQKNLIYNKGDPGSDYLVKKIIDGTIDVYSIGKMKSRDLRPSKTQELYDDIEKRKQQKIVKKYSTQHECFKCRGRKTTEVELQLRSLDEGSTLIITCEMDNCNNVWKLSS